MSERERVRISLNPTSPRHAQAWALLQTYEGKQRSEYVVDCILSAAETDRLEKLMVRVLDERLRQVQLPVSPSPVTAPDTDVIPASLLSFGDEF